MICLFHFPDYDLGKNKFCQQNNVVPTCSVCEYAGVKLKAPTSNDLQLLNHLLPVGQLPLHLVLEIIWRQTQSEDALTQRRRRPLSFYLSDAEILAPAFSSAPLVPRVASAAPLQNKRPEKRLQVRARAVTTARSRAAAVIAERRLELRDNSGVPGFFQAL